jgi:acetyl-CoA C-acetyltransferase
MPRVTNDRAPVLVGLGEIVCRPDEGPAPDPGVMMAEAVGRAAADAGPGALLGRVDVVAVAPSAGWPDGDPGRSVCEHLGIGARTLRASMQGGNGPQLLLGGLGAEIAAGRIDSAIVCGAEALYTLARNGGPPDAWAAADPQREADVIVEGEADPGTDAEREVGLIAPIMAYPLIENAIGHRRGESQDQHLKLISRLWAGFSEVAAGQPCAWTPEAHTAAELAHAGPENRLVTHPYRKLHNANIQVDQAAAVIVCSAEHARSLGVPSEKWVFLHASAAATDEWNLSERDRLDRSPAIAACGAALFEHTGAGPDDLELIDLYSCFPAAVQLAAGELGLGLDRRLTCTGGLTFFGGPGNNYATHGVIALARGLREAPEEALGLASALGWYATKHAIGLYDNRPPRTPFAAMEPPVARPPARTVAPAGIEYQATAETATVIYERDGSPSYGILFARLDDGRRVLGTARDPLVLNAMAGDGFLGAPVTRGADGSFTPA